MYKVTDLAGNVLVRFSSIGKARDWARTNRGVLLVNRKDKVIQTF